MYGRPTHLVQELNVSTVASDQSPASEWCNSCTSACFGFMSLNEFSSFIYYVCLSIKNQFDKVE